MYLNILDAYKVLKEGRKVYSTRPGNEEICLACGDLVWKANGKKVVVNQLNSYSWYTEDLKGDIDCPVRKGDKGKWVFRHKQEEYTLDMAHNLIYWDTYTVMG